jgi:hypothetical protein
LIDSTKPFSATNIFIATAIWSLLILRYGYFFGTGDHVELLPYTLFLNDNSFYSSDFFIQSLHATIPNERSVFANFLRPFSNHLEITILVLHLINTIFLLTGLYQIAQRFFDVKWHTWLPIGASILLFNDKALGNVDLYTPSLQAGDVACAIIAWAIALFLDKRLWTFTFMIILATFIHVLEGLDTMILLSIVLFISALQKDISLKKWIGINIVYLFTAGIYLALILLGKTAVDSSLSNHDTFKILFEFRHPHHFIFKTFPVFNIVLMLLLSIVSVFFFYKQSKQMFFFIIIGWAILIVYIIATDICHIISIANFQWYKVTQWIKVFSFIGTFALFIKYIKFKIDIDYKILSGVSIGIITICFSLIFLNKSPFKAAYQLGAKSLEYDDIKIAVKAKELTKKDALFVIPFDNSSFKYWSERSCYVEFKANVRNKKFVGEWYKRIGEVYGLDTNDTHIGFEKRWPANANFFNNANSDQIRQWKKNGVTNILIQQPLNNTQLRLLDTAPSYYLYKIN